LSAMPAIALSYDGDSAEYLEAVLPLVDFLEVTPDTLAITSGSRVIIPEPVLEVLSACSQNAGIIVHGVGLSIGSASGWSAHYLQLLDQLVERLPVAWHSEHLGYVTVDGQHLGTMLPLPRTDEALDLVAERVRALRERYGLPFLLENVVRVLPDLDTRYSEAAFLNALCDASGCELLLDLYNLECDAHNSDFSIAAFLDGLNLRNVRELHVASGVEHAGVLLDIHSRPLRDSTLALLRDVLARPAASVAVVTYELLPEAVPLLGMEVVAGELRRIRTALAHAA
jgi:uncharacterized protein (UPF0276 family)